MRILKTIGLQLWVIIFLIGTCFTLASAATYSSTEDIESLLYANGINTIILADVFEVEEGLIEEDEEEDKGDAKVEELEEDDEAENISEEIDDSDENEAGGDEDEEDSEESDEAAIDEEKEEIIIPVVGTYLIGPEDTFSEDELAIIEAAVAEGQDLMIVGNNELALLWDIHFESTKIDSFFIQDDSGTKIKIFEEGSIDIINSEEVSQNCMFSELISSREGDNFIGKLSCVSGSALYELKFISGDLMESMLENPEQVIMLGALVSGVETSSDILQEESTVKTLWQIFPISLLLISLLLAIILGGLFRENQQIYEQFLKRTQIITKKWGPRAGLLLMVIVLLDFIYFAILNYGFNLNLTDTNHSLFKIFLKYEETPWEVGGVLILAILFWVFLMGLLKSPKRTKEVFLGIRHKISVYLKRIIGEKAKKWVVTAYAVSTIVVLYSLFLGLPIADLALAVMVILGLMSFLITEQTLVTSPKLKKRYLAAAYFLLITLVGFYQVMQKSI